MLGDLRPGFPLVSRRRLGLLALVTAVAGANVVIGVTAGGGNTKVAVLLLLLPVAVGATIVAASHRDWLVLAALFLTMVGGTVNSNLPGTGGTKIFPADIFVGLALAGWVIERLTKPRGEAATVPKLRTIVLSWPLALFGLAILLGIFRGHERYGTSYLSQPARLVFDAAIGVAMIHMEPKRVYRQITIVFYAMTVFESLVGAYNLATGTSQTASSSLSTGGTRALALTTAMFLAAALVLALLNIELNRGRRGLHFLIAALALFGIVISLGRTTFGVLGVLVPILLITLRRLRRTLLAYLPVAGFLAVAAIIVLLQIKPSLGSTVAKRFTGHVGTDAAVVERQRKYHAALQGFDRTPILGFGFGRPVSFVSIDLTVKTFSGDPENSYIYVLAGGGVFALGGLLLLIVAFFGDAIARMRRTAGEERALVVFSASFAFILLVNTLSGPILSDPGLMLLVWIAMLLPAVARRRDGQPAPSPLMASS